MRLKDIVFPLIFMLIPGIAFAQFTSRENRAPTEVRLIYSAVAPASADSAFTDSVNIFGARAVVLWAVAKNAASPNTSGISSNDSTITLQFRSKGVMHSDTTKYSPFQAVDYAGYKIWGSTSDQSGVNFSSTCWSTYQSLPFGPRGRMNGQRILAIEAWNYNGTSSSLFTGNGTGIGCEDVWARWRVRNTPNAASTSVVSIWAYVWR